jgi:hypothetical protein
MPSFELRLNVDHVVQSHSKQGRGFVALSAVGIEEMVSGCWCWCYYFSTGSGKECPPSQKSYWTRYVAPVQHGPWMVANNSSNTLFFVGTKQKIVHNITIKERVAGSRRSVEPVRVRDNDLTRLLACSSGSIGS